MKLFVVAVVLFASIRIHAMYILIFKGVLKMKNERNYYNNKEVSIYLEYIANSYTCDFNDFFEDIILYSSSIFDEYGNLIAY